MGKTTCARIFAKSINCTSPLPNGDACGECESCKAFDQQRSLCIQELDAASNNTVDEIRELCKQVLIPPQGGKYKVFIIDEHYQSEDISLNRVAKEVNLSPNYLSAVFSQEMGTTFVEYLTARRMEKARELLRHSDLRSGEIAAAVGYKDSHYFSFLFKKTQGCTPRDYRGGKGKK